jgi:hypothetical protein
LKKAVDMNFSSNYILSEKEKKIAIGLMMFKGSRSDIKHGPFIIALLKELEWDLEKTLRVLNIGCSNTGGKENKSSPTVSRSALRILIKTIREAIILANYKDFMDSEGHIDFAGMVNSERFKLAYISKNTVLLTLRNYNINYTKRKRGKKPKGT